MGLAERITRSGIRKEREIVARRRVSQGSVARLNHEKQSEPCAAQDSCPSRRSCRLYPRRYILEPPQDDLLECGFRSNKNRGNGQMSLLIEVFRIIDLAIYDLESLISAPAALLLRLLNMIEVGMRLAAGEGEEGGRGHQLALIGLKCEH